jgi:Rha family phage regulatory protein
MSDIVQIASKIVNNFLVKHSEVKTTSLQIAEHFDKQHKNVLRDIEQLECSEGFNRLNFEPVKYQDSKGEIRPMYEITKDGFAFLVMGYRGKEAAIFKEAYILAFNHMLKEMQKPREKYKLSQKDTMAVINMFMFGDEPQLKTKPEQPKQEWLVGFGAIFNK